MQPTEVGFYWAKFLLDGSRRIVQVRSREGRLVVLTMGSSSWFELGDFEAWSERLRDPATTPNDAV